MSDDAAPATGSSDSGQQRVIDQIDVWRKQLINLSRSNRLLYFRRTRTSTLEIVRKPDDVGEVVDHVLGGGSWRFFFPRAPDETEQLDLFEPSEPEVQWNELVTSKTDPRDLRNTLRTLERRATQEFMDKGIWILYLAAGMLKWVDPETDDSGESPLVLVPVQLLRGNPRQPYELRRVDEDVVFNPALVVKLAEFGIELPGIDEDELDLALTLANLEEAVGSRSGWEVQRRLVVAPFSFHKEVMYRDLVKNEDLVADHQLVQALAVGAKEGSELDFEPIPEERLDELAPPESIVTIRDADVSQRQCISAAAAGHSFVMDGPPGTGKSQTIANVIAELLTKGKTVLFVSEKAAALEVVQKRLREAGLDDYCLELHSHKATRKEVAQQLGAALERHPVAHRAMATTDLAQLVRRRQELSARAKAMNEIRLPVGRSLHTVLGRIAQLSQLPQAPPPRNIGTTLSADELSQVQIVSQEISRVWGPVDRGDDFVWRDLADTALDAQRHQRARGQIQAGVSRLTEVERVSADAAEALLFSAPSDFDMFERLASVLQHLEHRPAIPGQWLSRENLDDVEARIQERQQLAMAYGNAEKTLLELVGSRWRDIPPADGLVLDRATEELQSLSLKFAPPEALAAPELRSLAQFLEPSTEIITSVKADAESVAVAFGLPVSRITLHRAAQLAELGSLVGQSTLPEPEWINPAVVGAVEQATKILRPLCTSFRERRAELGGVFTDDVLTLDLESLCQRFSSVHTGLGKLKRQYRADKRTVAEVARIGKASKAVLAMLPQAFEWQRLSKQLKTAEHDQAALIGPRYYQSSETDFEMIGRALESVRLALQIAGSQLNAEAMRKQLGRGGDPNIELLPVAARLQDSIVRWRREASSLLGLFAGSLSETECGLAVEWCRLAAAPMTQIANVAMNLSELSERPVTYAEVKRSLEIRLSADSAEQAIGRLLEEDRRELGTSYQGLETNWDALTSSVDWAAKLRDLLGGPVSLATADRLTSIELDWAELETVLADWYRARDTIASNFLESRALEVRLDLSTTFADAFEFLEHLRQTIADIDEWVEYQRCREQFAALKVGPVIDFCEATNVGAAHVAEVVERACLEAWADAVIEEDQDRLRHVRADQLDPIVEEFRKLDVEMIKLTAGRVITACNERRPRTTVGAAGIIKKEAAKQRRHMPVRKLLELSGEVAQALKPCFMMSPLTVSQFLPPTLHFDAVIFDEASQVRPSDAINCVYRGSQLIVAGDDKQLPPTSFFEAVTVDGDDEWEEDQFDEFESILQLSKGSGGFRELPLNWHYRSQHEDLIAYSNHSFYDGRLITFPGAAAEAGDLGVKFFHVPDGMYRRGTARDNPREAEVVVDRVLHWARDSMENPSLAATLGVVAFSEAQASTIETILERRRQEAPELDTFFDEDRLDGFFVKNLESVQGDERDVMIFSVGYGRDEVGKLTMNFGPLNRQGGERRLNVAITRARRRVELVSSITGTEPEFGTDLREGPRHLRRYLDYAARGPVALAIELGETSLDAESPFEEEVIRTIRSWGYQVQPQVGTAGYRVDIGVWNPNISGRFALGVECDGRMYHSSKVARDRDRLRQEVLERLGWRIYRIWGTSWYRNRPEQEGRLKAAIETAISSQGENQPRPLQKREVSDPPNGERFEVVALDEAPSWTVPYRVASPTSPRRLFEMHQPEAQPDLRRWIIEIIEVEGPIEDELLLQRLREAWGVGRAGSRIRQAFGVALQNLVRRREVNRLGRSCSYMGANQLQVVRVPGDNELARRTVAQVPGAEIMLAVKHLVEDARRVSRDELTFEVCRLFGWNRRGSDIAAALDEAVDLLVRGEAIVEDGGYLKLKPSGVVPSGLPRAGSEPGASITSPKRDHEGYANDVRFLASQRAALVHERATYLEQAASLKAEAEALVEEMEPGDIQFNDESGEGGTVTVDRERDLALSAQALAAVEEIDHTLWKMDNGTYGVCENCGKLIVKARLDALPYARLCIDCKSGGLSKC